MSARRQRRQPHAPAPPPRVASRDYVRSLQDSLRISRKACADILAILSGIDARPPRDLPSTAKVLSGELIRIRHLAEEGAGAQDQPASVEAASSSSDPSQNLVVNAGTATWPDGRNAHSTQIELERGRIYKTLTVHQPWASLLLTPHKRLETRGQRTNYRGPLAIHAGRERFKGGRGYDNAFLRALAVAFEVDLERVLAHLERDLPYGAVIGTVVVIGCRRIERIDFHGSDGGARLHLESGSAREISPAELAFGNFNPGRFIIETTHPVTFTRPQAARGNQGIWDWEPRSAA